MKDLATQAYLTYLHQMVAAHEEIRKKQSDLIEILESQVGDLQHQVDVYKKLYETLKVGVQLNLQQDRRIVAE